MLDSSDEVLETLYEDAELLGVLYVLYTEDVGVLTMLEVGYVEVYGAEVVVLLSDVVE